MNGIFWHCCRADLFPWVSVLLFVDFIVLLSWHCLFREWTFLALFACSQWRFTYIVCHFCLRSWTGKASSHKGGQNAVWPRPCGRQAPARCSSSPISKPRDSSSTCLASLSQGLSQCAQCLCYVEGRVPCSFIPHLPPYCPRILHLWVRSVLGVAPTFIVLSLEFCLACFLFDLLFLHICHFTSSSHFLAHWGFTFLFSTLIFKKSVIFSILSRDWGWTELL